MNKKWILIKFLTALIMIATMSSCKMLIEGIPKNRGVYDPTIPKEQLALLFISGNYTVISFDGKQVKWSGNSFGSTLSYIKVPAGKHRIYYKYSYSTESPAGVNREIRGGLIITEKRYIRETTKFEGELMVNMEAGKMYVLNYEAICETESPEYQKLNDL